MRSVEEYTTAHISGALWLRGILNDPVDVENKLIKSKAVCLYGPEDKTLTMAAFLKDKGFQKVFILPGGLTNWKAAGIEVKTSQSLNLWNYREKISSGIQLVYFYADWCAVCKMVSPIVQEVVASYPAGSIQLLRISYDEHPKLMDTLLIREIPLILLYKNGKEIARGQGFTQVDFWKKKINTIL